jgi:hypothetical protein
MSGDLQLLVNFGSDLPTDATFGTVPATLCPLSDPDDRGYAELRDNHGLRNLFFGGACTQIQKFASDEDYTYRAIPYVSLNYPHFTPPANIYSYGCDWGPERPDYKEGLAYSDFQGLPYTNSGVLYIRQIWDSGEGVDYKPYLAKYESFVALGRQFKMTFDLTGIFTFG